jgi:hypothetical protein
MFMAGNYTDTTDTDFKGIAGGVTYNIESGKPLSAEGVRNALHTKENVENKVTTLSASSTDAEYPSAKVVYDTLSNAGNELVHKSGAEIITGVKTFGKTDAAAEPKLGLAKTTDATNDGTKFASEAQVYAVSNAVKNKQDTLPIGTILMYDGARWIDNDTLKGWYACDKGNYNKGLTPDLEDKFIKGKGDETAAGANWLKLTEANLPDHAHNGDTSSDGSHNHDFKYLHIGGTLDNGEGDYLAGLYGQGQYIGSGTGDGRVCCATSSVMTDNSEHSHSIEIKSNGSSGTAFNNMPAYHSLIYIKRVA